jgi:hypothetical protein
LALVQALEQPRVLELEQELLALGSAQEVEAHLA